MFFDFLKLDEDERTFLFDEIRNLRKPKTSAEDDEAVVDEGLELGERARRVQPEGRAHSLHFPAGSELYPARNRRRAAH